MSTVPTILRAKQVCEYLSISKSYFYKLIANGHLPKGKRTPWGRSVMWFKEDLDRIVDEIKGDGQ